ncbi:MAG: hypothetical protein RI554_11445, partial [Trueperaceae bacterium]|nr:hypothetical protein [Trueperaceae bacterium]
MPTTILDPDQSKGPRPLYPATSSAATRRRPGFRVPEALGAALLVLMLAGWAHANYGFENLGYSGTRNVQVCSVNKLNWGDFIGFEADDPSTCTTFTDRKFDIVDNVDGAYFGFQNWSPKSGSYETAVIADGYKVDYVTTNGLTRTFGMQGLSDRTIDGDGTYGMVEGETTRGGGAWIGGACVGFGVDLGVTNFDSQIVTGPYDLMVRINTKVAFDASEVKRTEGVDGLGPASLADVPYETTIQRDSNLYSNYQERSNDSKFTADNYRFDAIVPDASGDVTYRLPQNTFSDAECVFDVGPYHTADSLTLTVDLAPRAVAGGFDAVEGAIEGSVSSSDGTNGSVTVSGGFDV